MSALLPAQPAAVQAPQDIQSAWDALGSDDAGKAYVAIWYLVQSPQETAPFLKARLQAIPEAPDGEAIDRWIRDLDSGTFAVRDKATRELEKLAELAERRLANANVPGLTLEMKQRIEKLQVRLSQPAVSTEQLRQLRAVEALELLGSAPAKQLLKLLAGGAAEARLTRHAKDALARLANRPELHHPEAALPKQDLFGDALPPGAALRLGTVRFRPASAAAFLPDCKGLVVCESSMLHLFDVSTGKEATGFPKKVTLPNAENIVVAPNGRFAAAHSDEGHQVVIWELNSGKQLHKFELKERHFHSISKHGLMFSPDSQMLYASNTMTACAWDLATGKELVNFKHCDGNTNPTFTVLSADGKLLATARLWDKCLEVWDVTTAKLVRRWEGADFKFINAGAFSKDGKTLATTAAGNLQPTGVRLWEVATGKLLRLLPGPCYGDVAFGPDDMEIAAAGRLPASRLTEADAVYLWKLDAKDNNPRILPAHGVRWLRFAPDGSTLAYGTFGRAIGLLDLKSGKELHPFNVHNGAVWRVAYALNGTTIATASEDNTIRLWDAVTGKPLWTLAGHSFGVQAIAVAADGKCLVSGSFDGTVIVWDAATGEKKRTFTHRGRVFAVAISPDGRFVASGGGERYVKVWDVAEGKLAHSYRDEAEDRRHGLAFSPDGRYLAESNTTSVRLRELATGKVIRTFRNNRITQVAFSPDGRTLAASVSLMVNNNMSSDDTIVLWEVLTGQERASFAGQDRYNHGCVAFSPDGKSLAFGSPAITIWDLATRREVERVDGHQDETNSFAFSPDGRRLATASRDTTVLVWHLPGR
jgi:WD40 repeat protein